MIFLEWTSLLAIVVIVPPLVMGTIRKIKARMQNRLGSPIYQPIFDLIKLASKGETVSDAASWVFRCAAAISFAIALYLAIAAPWIAPRPSLGSCDLFLFLYLIAAMRLCAFLAAMDTGSPFGAFAASREATLSFLAEPASILSLAALGVVAKSADLNVIFSFSGPASQHLALWLLSGSALLLASLVEQSRMPIDDPTTHLELTMVHEAMILEASGKNLALLEYANALKLSVLLGLSAQCYLHAIPGLSSCSPEILGCASISILVLIATALGTFEAVSVKLNWRKTPEFIAYALTFCFMASIVALGVNLI